MINQDDNRNERHIRFISQYKYEQKKANMIFLLIAYLLVPKCEQV